MMKKFSLFLIALISILNLKAQNKLEQTGPGIDMKGVTFFKEMIGEEGTFFYSLRYNTKGKGYHYFIEKYDKTTLTRTNSFPIGSFVYEEITKTVVRKNKCYVFSSKYSEEEKAAICFVSVINLTDGALLETRKVLAIVPCTQADYYYKSFLSTLSPDSSKVGILCMGQAYQQPEEVTYDLYDLETLKKLGGKKLPNQFKESLTRSNRFSIDKQGNLLYFFTYDINTKTDNASGGGLAKYFIANDKFISFNLKIKANTTLSNPNYEIDRKSGKILFYSMIRESERDAKDKDFKNAGLYIAKLDENSFTMLSEKTEFFNREMVAKLTCGDPNKKLSEIFFPFIRVINENEAFLGAQSYDRYMGSDGAIILTKLDLNALTTDWMKMIPRSGYAFSGASIPGYENTFGTMIVSNGDNLDFMFTEHPKFESNKLDYKTVDVCKTPFIGSDGRTNYVSYKIDRNGNITKNILYFNEKAYLIPTKINLKVSDGKYIVRFKKGKEESFGVMNLK